MIRHYQSYDYDQLTELFKLTGLQIPTRGELESYALVYEKDKQILGFVWVLIGWSKTAYVDYFVVHPDYRQKDATGRSEIAVSLMIQMLTDMAEMGKTKILGSLPKDNVSNSLQRIYASVGMNFHEVHSLVSGNPQEIVKNLIALRERKAS